MTRHASCNYTVNGGRTRRPGAQEWKGGETLRRRRTTSTTTSTAARSAARRPGRQGRGLVHRRDEGSGTKTTSELRHVHVHRQGPSPGRRGRTTSARRRRASGGGRSTPGAPTRTSDALKADVQEGRLVWDAADLGARPDGARRPRPTSGTESSTTPRRRRPGERHRSSMSVRAYLNEGGKLVKAGGSPAGRASRRLSAAGTLRPNELQPSTSLRLPYSRTIRPSRRRSRLQPAPAKLSTASPATLGDAARATRSNAAGYLRRRPRDDAARRDSIPQFASAGAGHVSPAPCNPYGPYAGDRTWPAPSTPTTPTTASPAPSTSPGSARPPTAARCRSQLLLEHRAGLRPRDRRGPHGRAPTTGPRSRRRAARRQHHRPRRVRAPRLPRSTGHPFLTPLPDPGRGQLHPHRAPAARGTAFTGASGWLAAGRLRPERLRGQAGRGLARSYITDPGAGGRGVLRRTTPRLVDRRHGQPAGGLRDVPGRLERARSRPAGSPEPVLARLRRRPESCSSTYGAVATRRHRAAGLRPGSTSPRRPTVQALLGKALAALEGLISPDHQVIVPISVG